VQSCLYRWQVFIQFHMFYRRHQGQFAVSPSRTCGMTHSRVRHNSCATLSFLICWVAKTQLNHWTKRNDPINHVHIHHMRHVVPVSTPPYPPHFSLLGLAAHFSVDACVYTCPCVTLVVCMYVCDYVCMYG